MFSLFKPKTMLVGNKAVMSLELLFVGFIHFTCAIIGVFPIVGMEFFGVQNTGEYFPFSLVFPISMCSY